MVLSTFKSKEQLKAEKYMEEELAKVKTDSAPAILANETLLVTNLRSAVNLLLNEPMEMSLWYYPLRRVVHKLTDYLGGETIFSQIAINHQGYKVDIQEGSVLLTVTDKFGILIVDKKVEMQVESVSRLSVNFMAHRLNELYRHNDDGIGYIEDINNVAIYLVYKDLFKITDHVKSEKVCTGDKPLSINYLARNVSYTLCESERLYVVETTSVELLKETLRFFYNVNPIGNLKYLGLEAVIQNELSRLQSRAVTVDEKLYGMIYTYYVDPDTAKLLTESIHLDDEGNINF